MAETNRLTVWVDEGLISADQAASIRAFEHGSSRTGSVAREVIGYLGALFILAAGLVISVEVWDSVKRGGRIAVSMIAAGLLMWAGVSMQRSTQRSTRRVGEVLLMLAAAPIGLAVGLTFGAPLDDEPSAAMGFLGAVIYSTIIYRWHVSWAQHVALFGSALGLAIALGVTISDTTALVAAALTAAVGVAWLAASMRGLLPPRILAELGAMVALLTSSLLVVADLDSDGTAWRIVLAGLAAAAAVVLAIGVRTDRVTIIGGGALGLVFFLPLLVDDLLPGELGGPLALLVVGAILVGTAVLLTRRANRGPSDERPAGQSVER